MVITVIANALSILLFFLLLLWSLLVFQMPINATAVLFAVAVADAVVVAAAVAAAVVVVVAVAVAMFNAIIANALDNVVFVIIIVAVVVADAAAVVVVVVVAAAAAVNTSNWSNLSKKRISKGLLVPLSDIESRLTNIFEVGGGRFRETESNLFLCVYLARDEEVPPGCQNFIEGVF
jgi:hypothetical protein